MSTVAIDNARNNERLSAFLAEIGANEPVDNFFPETPAINALMKKKQMQDGGRQIIYPIDSGENSTIKDFSDYDVFDTSAQDTARSVVYPMVNKGGSIVISWEEQRETAGNDHAIFDLLTHRRKNAMKTVLDKLAADLFAASPNALKITNLPSAVAASGSLGSLSTADDADWASIVVGSGSFATQGLSDMRQLYNRLQEDGKAPDTVLTTRAIYEFYENEIDPDVRYATLQTGGRGFMNLEFKGIPIMFDKKSNSGVLYMWNSENVFMKVDTQGNFDVGQFQTPHNQKASAALLTFRGNLVINRRRSMGKLTGVVA